MAVVLQTIADGASRARIGKEASSFPYSQVCLIDPKNILQRPEGVGYYPDLFQGKQILEKALGLYFTADQVIGLLRNSEPFNSLVADNQVVAIGSYDNACNTFPTEPITLDAFNINTAEKDQQHSLLLVGLQWSDFHELPMISLEFFPQARVLPAIRDGLSSQVLLPGEVTERGGPIFYSQSRLPPGTGRVDSETWRGRSSPVFVLLKYQSSQEFLIGPGAITIINGYANSLDMQTGEAAL